MVVQATSSVSGVIDTTNIVVPSCVSKKVIDTTVVDTNTSPVNSVIDQATSVSRVNNFADIISSVIVTSVVNPISTQTTFVTASVTDPLVNLAAVVSLNTVVDQTDNLITVTTDTSPVYIATTAVVTDIVTAVTDSVICSIPATVLTKAVTFSTGAPIFYSNVVRPGGILSDISVGARVKCFFTNTFAPKGHVYNPIFPAEKQFSSGKIEFCKI